jgi:hypothetical protein
MHGSVEPIRPACVAVKRAARVSRDDPQALYRLAHATDAEALRVGDCRLQEFVQCNISIALHQNLC